MHEWAKHGTCVSTLTPTCYGDDYVETEEVVDYVGKVIELFQGLPTYKVGYKRLSLDDSRVTNPISKWLEDAGIVPSNDVTYNLDDIISALSAQRGVSPVVACDHGELREAWYFFNVRGSVQTGQFVPSEPQVAKQHLKGCPRTGIKYLPKDV